MATLDVYLACNDRNKYLLLSLWINAYNDGSELSIIYSKN